MLPLSVVEREYLEYVSQILRQREAVEILEIEHVHCIM
jgi:hypothetical protein